MNPSNSNIIPGDSRSASSTAEPATRGAIGSSLPAPMAERRRGVWTGTLVVASLAITLGVWLALTARGRVSTDSAFVDGHRIAVAAQVPGRVSAVLVDDNQPVVAGQVLLRIDPADYQVKVDQAEAFRAQALGALAQARAQLPVTESLARQAAAQARVASANALKAKQELHRYRQLDDDSVARIVFDAFATQEAVASAQLEAAQQAAAGAEAQIALVQATVAAAQANLRASEALVAQAMLALSYTEVKASAAGYITRKSVEAGNFVQPGQPLINIVTNEIFVTANFKETEITHMRPGQAVRLTVDTYPGRTLRGVVDSRMAGTGSAFALLPPENATGNFVKVVQRVPVKIKLEPEDIHELPPLALGMSVVATVDVRQVAAPQNVSSL